MNHKCCFCGKEFFSDAKLNFLVCRSCADKKTRAIEKTVKANTGTRHGFVHYYRSE